LSNDEKFYSKKLDFIIGGAKQNIVRLFFIVLLTVSGFLGGLWWVFDLTVHFKVFYFFLLLIISTLLILNRSFKFALIGYLFTVVNLIEIIPAFIKESRVTENVDKKLSVVTFNLNSKNIDISAIHQVIAQSSPDILVLQETTPWHIDNFDFESLGFKFKITSPRKDNFGISLYSKENPVESNIETIGSFAPSVVASYKFDDKALTVIGTHPVPPIGYKSSSMRNDQLAAIAERTKRIAGHVIVAGDLNITPWSTHFKSMLEISGLKDAGRGFGINGTWPSFLGPIGIPIDRVLVSDDVVVKQYGTLSDAGSDHLPIKVDVSLDTNPHFCSCSDGRF
jgi:endonuclease/exonuclease/phosphatase (EEP) superfamily protein YafD